MKAYTQIMVDQFSTRLQEEFISFCKKNRLHNEPKTLLLYLIDNEIISQTHIRKYTILSEFEELCQMKMTNKSRIIKSLATKFNISDRAIWSMVRNHPRKPNDSF